MLYWSHQRADVSAEWDAGPLRLARPRCKTAAPAVTAPRKELLDTRGWSGFCWLLNIFKCKIKNDGSVEFGLVLLTVPKANNIISGERTLLRIAFKWIQGTWERRQEVFGPRRECCEAQKRSCESLKFKQKQRDKASPSQLTVTAAQPYWLQDH